MNSQSENYRGILRVVALIGAIRAIILLTVNASISGKHMLLGSTEAPSHEVIGLIAFVVGAVGAITTLFSAKWGAALMAIGGLGFIYVVGWGVGLAHLSRT